MYDVKDFYCTTPKNAPSATTNISFKNVLIVFATTLLSTFVVVIDTAPVPSIAQAHIYLSKFGYLPEASSGNGQLLDFRTLIQGVRGFQEFAGLDVTGKLDDNTLLYMSLPRCGVKDKQTYMRTKRNLPDRPSIWAKKELTYKISQYTSKMDNADVDEEISRAFNIWSDYADLSFTRKWTGPVDIEIKFAAGEHGDRYPFDGPSGVLAHAFYPQRGDAHFDEAEQWTLNTLSGTNLFQVAAHEFGHSLGLEHSSEQESIMAPFIREYDPNFQLHSNDIMEIQELYGRKRSKNIQKTARFHDDSDNGCFQEEEESTESSCRGLSYLNEYYNIFKTVLEYLSEAITVEEDENTKYYY